MNERAELAKEKRRKKFKNDGKKKKTAAEAAAVTPFMSPRDAVLALLEAMQAPQHVAVLSLAYKKKTGRAIKDDHRHGGMLNFIRTELKDEVLLVGSGNDSFAQLATPSTRAVHWLRECVRDNGPVLISMVGRLFHEAHGKHFGEVIEKSTLTAFLQSRLGKELTYEAQKGQEQLIELRARDAPRYFLPETSKKQRATDAPADADAAGASGAAGASEPAPLEGALGRGGASAYPASSRLLVVGEADFSWSEALLKGWKAGAKAGSKAKAAAGLTATSFDAAADLARKYDGVAARCDALRAAGATVLHGVDATALGSGGGAAAGGVSGPYDIVAFHFPHVGGAEGLAASIAANTAMLGTFLTAAVKVLAPGGEVHVTLVHRYPYTAWRKAWAEGVAGLSYLGCAPFEFGAFEGYRHQATTATAGLRGDTAAASLEVGTRCLTYAWRKAEEGKPAEGKAEGKAEQRAGFGGQHYVPAAGAKAGGNRRDRRAAAAPAKAKGAAKAKSTPAAAAPQQGEAQDDATEEGGQEATEEGMLSEANEAMRQIQAKHAAAAGGKAAAGKSPAKPGSAKRAKRPSDALGLGGGAAAASPAGSAKKLKKAKSPKNA